MIYLASPYSHPDRTIRRTRFFIAENFVLHCLRQNGVAIFSPIVYWHKMADDNTLPTDAQFWQTFNTNMIRRSESMFFLKLRGWEESKGCTLELRMAKLLGIPIIEFDEDFRNLTLGEDQTVN